MFALSSTEQACTNACQTTVRTDFQLISILGTLHGSSEGFSVNLKSNYHLPACSRGKVNFTGDSAAAWSRQQEGGHTAESCATEST